MTPDPAPKTHRAISVTDDMGRYIDAYAAPDGTVTLSLPIGPIYSLRITTHPCTEADADAVTRWRQEHKRA